MPSTFSPSLKIELIANGEQAGTWGQTTNNNLGTLIEQAIAGVDTIDLTGYSTYTLSNYNGISDEARNAAIIFNGTLTTNCTVTTPAVEKLYVISNQTTGGYYVTVSSGSGNTISVANGTNQLMYCDGTNYNTAISNINNVAGDLTVTGSIFLGANLTSTTGNLTLNAYSNVVNMGNNTGALIAPIGTTAQRPTALVAGMVRWNTTTSAYEVYTGSIWINLLTSNYSVNYLIVAGGGGGGYSGGGGGAGGLLANSTTLDSGTSYSVVIGSGGAGGISAGSVASVNGSNSTVFSLTAVGGGAGGCGGGGGLVAAGSGGSGGGGGRISYTTTAGGSGTLGQGNSGGNGASPAPYPSGGGGGAGAGGGSGSAGVSGNGGVGTASSISGSSVYYAGGGGGGTDTTVPPATGVAGTGGNGGGGDGGPNIGFANNGTANTGGGGGGGNNAGDGGGTGGSGIVIISYPGTQRGSGGTITSASNNTIHTFTSSGTYVA